ncbi:MAG: hypothetical protein CM15mP83_0080 [Flavobacteriaceae bacterium]|nr:MAG: hypothetical protein CM15mP83_0080 [Flavobacteriaceae bacterium]
MDPLKRNFKSVHKLENIKNGSSILGHFQFQNCSFADESIQELFQLRNCSYDLQESGSKPKTIKFLEYHIGKMLGWLCGRASQNDYDHPQSDRGSIAW